MGPPTLFTIPVLRYMKTYDLTHEQLAMVSVVQREWARTRAPPSRRHRFPRLARTLGDDLEIGSRWRVRLAAALFPILQSR